MLWAGSRKEQEPQQTQADTAPEDESITIIPIIPEEPEEFEARAKKVLNIDSTFV
jgi:hypothetical protein